jgi:hypothetical protein
MTATLHTDAIDYYIKREAMWNLLGESIIAGCEGCWLVNRFIIKKLSTIKEGEPEDTGKDIISVTEFSIKDFDETLTAIDAILSKIKDGIAGKVIGSPNVEYLMIVSQSLKGARYLLEDIQNLLKESADTEKVQLCTNSLLYILTNLLAVSMGITDFDKLYECFSLAVMHTNPRRKIPVDERAFSILNSDEIIKEKYEKNR